MVSRDDKRGGQDEHEHLACLWRICMKLVSLNILMGKITEPLLEFLQRQKSDTDIFCFQEVWEAPSNSEIEANPIEGSVPDTYSRLAKALDGFDGYLGPAQSSFGQRKATFVSKRLTVGHSGELGLCERERIDFASRGFERGSGMQWLSLSVNGKTLTLGNVHGFWTPDGKGDIPQRIRQSKTLLEFMDGKQGQKILCGDFNLNPDTESVRMIAEKFRDLVKEYGVKTTRSRLCRPGIGLFADYMFVSEGIKVTGFSVPDEEVSDHLPLLLSFEIL